MSIRSAAACVAALAACGAAAAGCGAVAAGASGHAGPGLVLRPATPAVGCTPPRTLPDRPAPAAVRRDLPALRRPATSADGLPVLNRPDRRGSDDLGWLPLRSVDLRGVRRIGGSRPPVYVVPSAGVLRLEGEQIGANCPAAIAAPTTAGACLVVGAPGGPFGVRCWTLAEIDAGRALALVGGDRAWTLVGLVGSGARVLRISAGTGPPLRLHEAGGVVDVPTALRPGTRIVTRVG